MKFDSLSKKSKKTKKHQPRKHQPRKWLAAVFILIFSLASIGFINLSRAQEALTNEPPAETTASPTPEVSPLAEPSVEPTPEVLLPADESGNQSENASSTPVVEPLLDPLVLDGDASSTPETAGTNDLSNASSTDFLFNPETGNDVNASSTPAIVIVPNDVGTGLDLSFSDNERPVVQAIWEMNLATSSSDQGKDVSLMDGAQFMPSGQYQVDKTIEVCAVVSDPDGLADLANVSSQIYYPENIYLGPNRLSSQPGCGQAKGEWFNMTALESSEGLDLFCQQVRNNNANLPSFKTGNDFDALCGPAGELTKGTSKVFCGQASLSYQDPAGDYRVKAAALDQKNEAGVLENSFKYLELVAFEIDFDNIDYGSMRLNSPKILSGNETFLANDGRPTLRNIGNTRLEISIKQNDMGLGQSETGWNLTYQARVGQEASFANYWPEAWATLVNLMNLGQTSQLDLTIEVLKFPEIAGGEHYAGKLSLNATAAPQLVCAE